MSTHHSSQDTPPPALNPNIAYQSWVYQQKRQWYDKFLSRHPPDRSPPSFPTLTHSGHDWWFIDHTKHSNILTLGVADGVGGWESEHGVDPAEVAQGLMYHASTSPTTRQPLQILIDAYRAVLTDDHVGGGASTALVAQLDPRTSSANWACLGDSALVILRDGGRKVMVATDSQTHYFNCPFQLTKIPKSLRRQRASFGDLDQPDSASVGCQTLEDGDLVLLFTDGMADNLWIQEITGVVQKVWARGKTDEEGLDDLVHTLCGYARLVSFKVGFGQGSTHGYGDWLVCRLTACPVSLIR